MLTEFSKYQGINVLQFFLEHPETDIHIKELARRLDVSPATSKRFCNLFASKNIILSEQKGNAIFFRLNESDSYVKLLKKTYAITRIREHWTPVTIEEVKTIAVYGSQVSGEYKSQSDIDMLILTRQKREYPKILRTFQEKIEKEVNITVMTYIQWQQLKREEDPFATEVLENHHIIQGERL
jgi:predicted nucleotidyltransferase